MQNKYGLPRDIPDDVQREVRQRCGFGCVVCGCAIYQYEHIEPTFAEAHEHDPAKIALLCGGCHDRVTRGLLSKSSIKAALAAPKAKSLGFSFGPFDVGLAPPDVFLGPFQAIRTTIIIDAFGTPLFQVEPPETDGGPFRLSALMCDASGTEVLRIVRNEWRTPIENWDVEVVGQRITVRRASRDITLRLRTEPPHALIVERLRMYFQGALLECEESKYFRVTSPEGSVFYADGVKVVECEAGIVIRENGLSVGYRCKGGLVMNHVGKSQNQVPAATPEDPKRSKTKRNSPCPCGSGRKFKKCCGAPKNV